MNILSIGNSFSQDAQRYIHKIAKSDNVEINTYNLYIGGCSLARHYRNMLSEESAYTLEMNGTSTGFCVSLKDALLNRDWDIVTLQQVSRQSNDYSTFQPYLNRLADYVRQCVPKAEIVFHQTWSYERDSHLLNDVMNYNEPDKMLEDIKSACYNATCDISADFIIPSGEVMSTISHNGIKNTHRDTLHASNGEGRFALGLLWYAMFSGNDINNNPFSDFDEPISNENVKIIKDSVNAVLKNYQRGNV